MVICCSCPRGLRHLAYVRTSPFNCPLVTYKEFGFEKLFPCSDKLQTILLHGQKLTVLGTAEILERSGGEIVAVGPSGQLEGFSQVCSVLVWWPWSKAMSSGLQIQKHLSFFFFWPYWEACGILVPWPGIEPGPSAVKAQSPKHWTTREFPETFIFLYRDE